jgi:hypothetical protein
MSLLLAHSRYTARWRHHGSYRTYYGPNAVLDNDRSPCRSLGLKAVWPSRSRHSTIKAMRPEWPAPNRHLSQSTRHVADRCGLGLDPGALGGHGGALGLEGGPGPAIWLAATIMPDMPTLSYRAYPLGSENRLIVSYRADASSSADLRRRSRNTGMSSRSGGGRVGDEAAVSFGGSDAGSGTEEGDGAVCSTGASRPAVAPAGGVGGRTLCPFAASGRAGLGASLLVGTPLCSPFRPIPPFESATAPQCPSLLVCGTFKSATGLSGVAL